MAEAKKIWDFLLEKIGSPYGAAGLMGNLYAESGLNPKNLQNSYEKKLGMTDESYTAAVDAGTYADFDTDEAGYGLAQWTYPARKHNLRAYCLGQGASIGDLTAQLGFLWQELQGYTAVLSALRTAGSVREASDAVLLKYEKPADTSQAMREKRAEYGQRYFDEFRAATAKRTGKEFMTAEELVGLLKYVAGLKTIYMYAAYGFQVTDATIAHKAKQNLNGWYTPANIARLRRVANETPPTWGFDCVNLLKGILWGWRGDESKTYGGAVYGAHGVPDTNANGMIKKCYDVSDDFSGGLEPGEGLWMEGHWGTYIGGGLCVECTTRWKGTVQVTAVWNLGRVPGYNGREWTKHGKLPWIYYGAAAEAPGKEPAEETPSAPSAPANPAAGGLTYQGLLKRGAKGAYVAALQAALNKLGFNAGAADGIFGPKTEAALRRMQEKAGIEADGEFGPLSCAALNRMLGEEAPSGSAAFTVKVTAATSAWVREGPGTEYRKLTAVTRGETLTAFEQAGNGWFRVAANGKEGWISGRMARRVTGA